MRYYVLGPNGERYGPAEVPTLSEWAASNRLFPTSKLVDEMSGTVVVASTVPGISFGQAAPTGPAYPMQPLQPMQPIAPLSPGEPYRSPPAAGQAFARPGYMAQGTVGGDSGMKDLLLSFLIAVGAPLLGFITIYGVFIAVAGVQMAWRAYQKGQKLAILALVLNVLAIGGALYMRFFLRYQVLYGGHSNY